MLCSASVDAFSALVLALKSSETQRAQTTLLQRWQEERTAVCFLTAIQPQSSRRKKCCFILTELFQQLC